MADRPAAPVVSPADTPRMWNDRIEAAFQAYLEWKDTLPASFLMDKLLKAAGTRDLIVERAALLAVGERDRRQIARYEKALCRIGDSSLNWAARVARAVLADKEDAGNG